MVSIMQKSLCLSLKCYANVNANVTHAQDKLFSLVQSEREIIKQFKNKESPLFGQKEVGETRVYLS